MLSIIQRVSKASVCIKNKKIASINNGLLLLLGVFQADDKIDIKYTVNKVCNLRIFPDGNNKMNYSLKDINGEILVISQFTLCSDIKKGRRPSFLNAAKPEQGKNIYNKFIQELKKEIISVKTGIFGENMSVSLINSGPVTLIIDSKND